MRKFIMLALLILIMSPNVNAQSTLDYNKTCRSHDGNTWCSIYDGRINPHVFTKMKNILEEQLKKGIVKNNDIGGFYRNHMNPQWFNSIHRSVLPMMPIDVYINVGDTEECPTPKKICWDEKGKKIDCWVE